MRDLLAVLIIGGGAVLFISQALCRVGVDLGALDGLQLDVAHDGIVDGNDLARRGGNGVFVNVLRL